MHRKWLIFGFCAALFLMSMLYRTSNAVIAPLLAEDLGLDYQDLGLLGAVFFYAFALVQLPMGLVLDRIGPRLTLTVLNLAGAAGAVIFAQTEGLTGGVIGRGLLGLGMSANLMGSLQLLTLWFPPKIFATLIGLTMALGYLGSMLATSPLAWLAGAIGWRNSFLILAAANALLALAVFIWVGNRPPQSATQSPESENDNPRPVARPVKTLTASPTFWTIALTAFMRYGAFAALQTLWAGPFLIIGLGLSPVSAGHLLLALNIGFICGAPTGGMIADKWLGSRKRTVQVGIGLFGLTMITLAFWPAKLPLWWLGGLFFILGFFNSWSNIIYAHIKEAMPSGMSATAMTGVNFFTMMGAGVFLHGLGGILARFSQSGQGGTAGFRAAFLVCAAAVGLALVVYSFSREDRVIKSKTEPRIPG